MASILTTLGEATEQRGFAGSVLNTPVYIQFVPGYVVEVVHSSESLRYGGETTLNTIIALPHITEKLYKTRTSAGGEYRYYPLFRTMHDLPSKGDPVLLCTIGKTKYYLGPLNTNNNSPTWNDDPSFRPEIVLTNNKLGQISTRGIKGESPNFNKEKFRRLSKYVNQELDYGNAINETTGDTIIEGRHGNSIRIGSRSDKPYLFISNERDSENTQESLGDGTLISITSNGTLAQHFPRYFIDDDVSAFEVNGFTLASDFIRSDLNETPPNKSIGKLISNVNNQDSQEIYTYTGNQILFNSDRIIINSKLDDTFLSSNKDIHIGSKRNLNIATKTTIIDSDETFIGNPSPNGERRDMESMVLGTKLLELLNETLDVIKNSHGICQGAPIPLTDSSGTPANVNRKITDIQNKINSILSTKHFIEPNA